MTVSVVSMVLAVKTEEMWQIRSDGEVIKKPGGGQKLLEKGDLNTWILKLPIIRQERYWRE